MGISLAGAEKDLIRHDCAACGSVKSRPFRQIEGWQLVCCAACGAVYLNPSPTEAALRDLYNEAYFSGLQLQHDHTQDMVEKGIQMRMAPARQLVGDVGSQRRWLDVGCASGYLIAAGKRLGCEVEGVEVSAWAVRFAVDVLGLSVFRGTLREYCRVSSGSRFELITAMAYLEHSPMPLEDLRAMAGLMAPGGDLVVRVPNLDSFDRRWHGDQWRGWSLPHHLYHFTASSLTRLLERAGFTLYRLDIGFWNPVVHLREALRGDGLRADHVYEGRESIPEGKGRAPDTGESPSPLKAHLKMLLGRIFSGRDMILYAHK